MATPGPTRGQGGSYNPIVDVSRLRRECLKDGIKQSAFETPDFFVRWQHLEFCTGVDKRAWRPLFLLPEAATLQLLSALEREYGVRLHAARRFVDATARDAEEQASYMSVQRVNMPTQEMATAVVEGLQALVKRAKSQTLYLECSGMMRQATALVAAAPPAVGSAKGSRAVMFLSLDFEWWERNQSTLLEVGWSMWDTLTRTHRSRHWIVKENLNKSNGRFVSDNRMNFAFGTSSRGSLDQALSALQREVDSRGLTEGLTRSQHDALQRCDVQLVLVGHDAGQDMVQAELHEIEWPDGLDVLDTQRLFLAWQLQRMPPDAAGRALDALVGGGGGGLSTATATVTHVTGHGDDSDDGEDDVLMVSQRAAVAAAAPAPRKKGKGPAKQQMPQRARPWPAGPAPADVPRPITTPPAPEERVERQAGLAAVLDALGIRCSKLHNAGNDARYTMEAMLALAGQKPCPDPEAEHAGSVVFSEAYQEELRNSLAAAASQGWGCAPRGHRSAQQQQGGTASGSGGNNIINGTSSGRALLPPQHHQPLAAAAANGFSGHAGNKRGGGNGGGGFGGAATAAGGFAARNSSTDRSEPAAQYEPNPDGW